MKIDAVFGLKRTFLVAALLLLAQTVFAAAPGQRDWWYTLRRGQAMFGRGDYGNALLAFDDARRDRRATFDRMERDLVEFLSMGEVRRMGDSLDWAERFAREGRFAAAVAALDELFFRVPRGGLGNSVAAALEAFGTLRYFPEAEMWIGRTFRAGGELNLARAQFEIALSRREFFESPALATELLYELAEVHGMRGDLLGMERALLEIVEAGALWGDGGEGWQAGPFAREAMLRTLRTQGVDRLLTLYRYGNAGVMRAHRELGFLYAAMGRHGPAQQHLMFAFVIQNTVIIDEIIRRRFDFRFTTLEALADEIARDPFLAAYAAEGEYYRVAFYLGNSLFHGHRARAEELWRFVAGREGAGEWRTRAAAQLRSPRVGATIVAP